MDKMSPREQYINEMQRLATAISKTKSEKLKTDYQKRLKKMRHELKIYDALQRGEKIGEMRKA